MTYLVLSAVGLLAPAYGKLALTIATPVLFGEVALMLWLLIVGARERPLAVVPRLQVESHPLT